MPAGPTTRSIPRLVEVSVFDPITLTAGQEVLLTCFALIHVIHYLSTFGSSSALFGVLWLFANLLGLPDILPANFLFRPIPSF